MIDGVSPMVVQVGAFGILLMVIISLYIAIRTGQLVPKPTMEELKQVLSDRAAKAEEREMVWQQAADKWREAATSSIAQQKDLMEQGRTVIALVSDRLEPPGKHRQSD